jgi:chromosome segregation ATPase
MAIDTDFPSFTGEETPAQQIRALHNYLFQLREGLKYSLQNLTTENFNAAALQSLSDAQKNEVTKQLEKVYSELNKLTTEVDRLKNRFSEAEGKIVSLDDNVGLLSGRISVTADAVGDLQKKTSDNMADIQSLKDSAASTDSKVAELSNDILEVKKDLQKVAGIVQVAEDGTITLGAEGKVINLVGQIYINGELIGQGGAE